jgi:hypothetical protein
MLAIIDIAVVIPGNRKRAIQEFERRIEQQKRIQTMYPALIYSSDEDDL